MEYNSKSNVKFRVNTSQRIEWCIAKNKLKKKIHSNTQAHGMIDVESSKERCLIIDDANTLDQPINFAVIELKWMHWETEKHTP